MSLFALVDVKRYYCSCERVFNPRLQQVPVVVLSNNDGCVIARTTEAKALGIRMGTPLFQIRDLVRQHGVKVYSSNYALYGDMSRRAMSVIGQFSPRAEIYSIDECFLDLDGFQSMDLTALPRPLLWRLMLIMGSPVKVQKFRMCRIPWRLRLLHWNMVRTRIRRSLRCYMMCLKMAVRTMHMK